MSSPLSDIHGLNTFIFVLKEHVHNEVFYALLLKAYVNHYGGGLV